MAVERSSLEALKGLIEDADLVLETAPSLPENRTTAARESLRAAIALADDLLKESRKQVTPAAVMGRKGGTVTAQKLGSEHYRRMAAARKTHGGGRPRNQSE